MAIAGLAVTSVACGPSSTRPMLEEEEPPDNRQIFDTPSFATDINEILRRRGCANHNCHGTPGGRANLMLTADPAHNYAQLVNVPALSEGYMRILPNNPDSSYVVIRLRGQQTVGLEMPIGGPLLDSIDMTNVINWINTGAPNN